MLFCHYLYTPASCDGFVDRDAGWNRLLGISILALAMPFPLDACKFADILLHLSLKFLLVGQMPCGVTHQSIQNLTISKELPERRRCEEIDQRPEIFESTDSFTRTRQQ